MCIRGSHQIGFGSICTGGIGDRGFGRISRCGQRTGMGSTGVGFSESIFAVVVCLYSGYSCINNFWQLVIIFPQCKIILWRFMKALERIRLEQRESITRNSSRYSWFTSLNFVIRL